MSHRSALWLWTLPLAWLGGCLLPSFENVPTSVAEGGSGNAGEPGVVAGAAGEQAQGGTPAGGEGNTDGRAAQPVADSYVVQQGKPLVLSAADGVLSNDTPARLEVTDFSHADKARPKAYDAELDIAPDGSLTFTPADAFFGRYVADYTVTTPDGQTATSTVTFLVQPSAVGLDAVADGVGGVLLSGGGKDALGVSLAPLGDVNADGFADFAVGASGASEGYGSVYVVFGRPDFSALTLGALADSSSEARFAVLAGSQEAPISRFVSSAGRFDSDKQQDIVVGSPESEAGTVFVVYGGANFGPSLTLTTPMPAARGVAFSGVVSGSRLGLQVSGAGDFNGDNKRDLIAGLHRDGSTQGGLCLLLENPVASVSLDEVEYGVVPDSGVFDLPQALSFAGDLTGDGKDDVLASSARHVALLFGQGSVAELPDDISLVADQKRGLLRMRENGASGSAPVAALGDVNGDDQADFAYCDQFSGEALCKVFFGPRTLTDSLADADWQLGDLAASPALPLLASGADLNQDGFADLLLAEADTAYVVFGRDAGFGAVDVASLGSDGFSLEAPAEGKLEAIATIGDVNGDGFEDFAFGVPSAAGGSGYVYVVLGGPFAADQR
jgi:hypothetical protein